MPYTNSCMNIVHARSLLVKLYKRLFLVEADHADIKQSLSKAFNVIEIY